MGRGRELLQGTVSRVIIEIGQASEPTNILQIRLGGEQEALRWWEGVLHVAKLEEVATSDQQGLPTDLGIFLKKKILASVSCEKLLLITQI